MFHKEPLQINKKTKEINQNYWKQLHKQNRLPIRLDYLQVGKEEKLELGYMLYFELWHLQLKTNNPNFSTIFDMQNVRSNL